MHILFVTSSDPATNPRTVKEMELALREGHRVSLVYFESNHWSADISKKILNRLEKVECHPVELSWWPLKLKLGHIWSRISRMSGKFLHWNKLRGRAIMQSDRSYYLHLKLRSLRDKPDMVIGHTLSAFTPAYQYAKKHSLSLGLDVEDYHPGENFPAGKIWSREYVNRMGIMDDLLPLANYVSYASPSIRLKCLESLSNVSENKHITIENAFWKAEFSESDGPVDGPLKLIWFSQNIGANRGLEELSEALNEYDSTDIQVHLIGNVYHDFFVEYLEKHLKKIEIIPPMPQVELHKRLSDYDVGLAFESKKADLNRDLCLTNKIWAYTQSGLYVLASDTTSQKQFMTEHINAGHLFELSVEGIKKAVRHCIDNKASIRQNRMERYQSARQHAYEIETTKLLEQWKSARN